MRDPDTLTGHARDRRTQLKPREQAPQSARGRSPHLRAHGLGAVVAGPPWLALARVRRHAHGCTVHNTQRPFAILRRERARLVSISACTRARKRAGESGLRVTWRQWHTTPHLRSGTARDTWVLDTLDRSTHWDTCRSWAMCSCHRCRTLSGTPVYGSWDRTTLTHTYAHIGHTREHNTASSRDTTVCRHARTAQAVARVRRATHASILARLNAQRLIARGASVPGLAGARVVARADRIPGNTVTDIHTHIQMQRKHTPRNVESVSHGAAVSTRQRGSASVGSRTWGRGSCTPAACSRCRSIHWHTHTSPQRHSGHRFHTSAAADTATW